VAFRKPVIVAAATIMYQEPVCLTANTLKSLLVRAGLPYWQGTSISCFFLMYLSKY